MFYGNKSIRLHNKCLAILDLIQQSNNRHEDKRSTLARFDKSAWDQPVRFMNDRDSLVEMMERYERLSQWLVNRYAIVMAELIDETTKRLLPSKNITSEPINN